MHISHTCELRGIETVQACHHLERHERNSRAQPSSHPLHTSSSWQARSLNFHVYQACTVGIQQSEGDLTDPEIDSTCTCKRIQDVLLCHHIERITPKTKNIQLSHSAGHHLHHQATAHAPHWVALAQLLAVLQGPPVQRTNSSDDAELCHQAAQAVLSNARGHIKIDCRVPCHNARTETSGGASATSSTKCNVASPVSFRARYRKGFSKL